jgi:hypothetical protein
MNWPMQSAGAEMMRIAAIAHRGAQNLVAFADMPYRLRPSATA